MTSIIVYSNNEVNYYERLFPKLKNKFKFVRYGRDYPNPIVPIKESNYCFSGGGSNRDYLTLVKALNICSNIKCIIATRPNCINIPIIPPNISIKYNITINSFGSWIANSNFFILSLDDVELSAGHMAMLEAMNNGKIIIVNDIPAIRSYVNDSEVIMYKSGDYISLANKIDWVNNNLDNPQLKAFASNAKSKYDKEYTFLSLLKRLVKTI